MEDQTAERINACSVFRADGSAEASAVFCGHCHAHQKGKSVVRSDDDFIAAENLNIVREKIPEPGTAVESNEEAVSFSEIIPIPGILKSGDHGLQKNNKRKQHSQIFTATPMKDILEEKEMRKGKRLQTKQLSVENSKRNLYHNPGPSDANKENSHKRIKVQREKAKKVQYKEHQHDFDDFEGSDNEVTKDICIICGEFGKNNEMWIRRSKKGVEVENKVKLAEQVLLETTDNKLLSENPVKENILTSRAFENPDKKDRLGTFSGKCAYCRVKGHHINECNKKHLNKIKTLTETTVSSEPNAVARTVLLCYGCGTPGVIRSNCSKCRSKTSAEAVQPSSEPTFCELDAKKLPSLQRPILPIQIWDSNGTAIATRSVAGETLYNLLKNSCCFTRQNFSVILADGTDTPQEVLTTTIPIQIAHKTITVEMIVLPNAKSNRTLLGINFLSKARFLLNTADQTWYFIENPKMPFPYATETRIDGSLVESSTSVDNVSFTSFREDEGTMLTPDQRRSLPSIKLHFLQGETLRIMLNTK
ncbi:hypothetical protein RN001_013710 [Aquatica leii]|uniref:Uncharacterized protein n=1 Tax=Aquatica leii TaxID=1421715 RepID=A0AAN7SNU5_9COLE|nr:hypothetical protein RN001_013710 [Aquatica leii]